MAVEGEHDALGRQPDAVDGGVDDAPVGLVGDVPRHLVGGDAGPLEDEAAGADQRPGGGPEDGPTVHPEVLVAGGISRWGISVASPSMALATTPGPVGGLPGWSVARWVSTSAPAPSPKSTAVVRSEGSMTLLMRSAPMSRVVGDMPVVTVGAARWRA